MTEMERYVDDLQRAYEEQLARANRLEKVARACADKLETRGNEEPRLVARRLRDAMAAHV